MQLALRDDLILLPVTVVYQGQEVKVPDVVVDTGSATTMLSTDVVAQVGITPELHDVLHIIRGVGGTEVVFSRRVDRLQVGPRAVEQFEIEVGGIDPPLTSMAFWGWISSCAPARLSTWEHYSLTFPKTKVKKRGTDAPIPQTFDRSRPAHPAHLRPRPAGEIHPPRPHLHAALMWARRPLTMTDLFQCHGAQPTRRRWRKSQLVVA